MTTTIEQKGHEANWGSVQAQHPAWCRETVPNHGDECQGDTESVLGVNLGTAAHLVLTSVPGSWMRPVAELELTKAVDERAGSVYLDVAGLRALAGAAETLADELESTMGEVIACLRSRP